jgi:hypothetical protein
LVVGAGVAWRRADPTFPLVLAWAFAGIAVRNAAIPTVVYTAWAATAIALVLAFLGWRRPVMARAA